MVPLLSWHGLLLKFRAMTFNTGRSLKSNCKASHGSVGQGQSTIVSSRADKSRQQRLEQDGRRRSRRKHTCPQSSDQTGHEPSTKLTRLFLELESIYDTQGWATGKISFLWTNLSHAIHWNRKCHLFPIRFSWQQSFTLQYNKKNVSIYNWAAFNTIAMIYFWWPLRMLGVFILDHFSTGLLQIHIDLNMCVLPL